MSSSAVYVQQLQFSYGRATARNRPELDRVDLNVPRGVIYALLGPSGCGKTTLLRCIIGRLRPQKGIVKVFNNTKPGNQIGYMPQHTSLFDEFTIEENLRYFGRLYGMNDYSITIKINELLKLLDMPEKSRIVSQLSGGQQRRVSLCVALIHSPMLVILDEPTVGVDPILRQQIWDYLEMICEKNLVSVIITTHYIEEARNASTIAFLRDGQILVEQNPELLLKKYNCNKLEDAILILCKNNRINKRNRDIFDGKLVQEIDNRVHENISLSKKNLWALLVKNMIGMKRNMPILLFYFLLPSIQIALFCICIGQDPKNINVAVFNEEELTSGDGFGLAVQFLHYIDKEIVVQTHYDSLEKARQAVIDGKAWAALHFSANFSASLDQRRKDLGKATNETIAHSNIKLYLDTSNQVIGFVLMRTFFNAFQTFAQEFLALIGFNPASVTLPISIEKVIYGNLNPSMTEFMAPGVTILIAYYATTALSALSLVVERKDGLLERSLVAGVTTTEFLLSHVITQTLVLAIQQVFMLITTFGVFGVPSRGPMIWVFSLTFFQGLAGVMFGLFIASLCADEVSVAMLGMGSFFPTIMLGGIFWPIQSMPDWMATFASFLPQTLPVNAMRFILSRGWDVSYFEVMIGFIASWCWILVYLVAAAFIFKKYA